MDKLKCPKCLKEYAPKKDGTLRKHPCFEATDLERALDDGATPHEALALVVAEAGFDTPVSDPAPTVETMDDDLHDFRDPVSPTKGPWFGAMYAGTCDGCFDRIEEGDRIRADGEGGYECEDCGESEEPPMGPDHPGIKVRLGIGPAPLTVPVADMVSIHARNDWQAQASAAAERYVAAQEAPVVELRIPAAPGPMSTPDEFDTPATVVAEVKLNVSGQPPARRDHLKRYIVIDPELGDFRRTKKERKPFGVTRATTFNKHAQNTIALTGWSKRNVVMGASLRPDILRRAHGLTHDNGKDQLDRIVNELETAAGAKVSANEGTFLHEFCDEVDAGLKTWQDAPPMYQQDIKRYVEALAAAGLEPVPGLIERTTFIREFGGVAGTFDRIFYHRPSGQYIPGDLKTGKTMMYAMDETECQIWTYAHGVNQTGIYDWNTDTWSREDPSRGGLLHVSETVGVIIHMPVQGPEAGEVYLRFADLERGKAYAELNHAVNSYVKSKVVPFEMPPSVPLTWGERFADVKTSEDATKLWKQAKAAGIEGVQLNLLIAVARQALARVDTGS